MQQTMELEALLDAYKHQNWDMDGQRAVAVPASLRPSGGRVLVSGDGPWLSIQNCYAYENACAEGAGAHWLEIVRLVEPTCFVVAHRGGKNPWLAGCGIDAEALRAQLEREQSERKGVSMFPNRAPIEFSLIVR